MNLEFVFKCECCQEEVPLETIDEKNGVCSVCSCANRFEKVYIGGNILILSIDIGIRHLALVLSSVNEKYEFEKIVWFDLADITEYKCDKNCKLYHGKNFADWLLHCIHRYEKIFQSANVILIEKQPPQGLVVVEQILFGCFRDKSILIYPNSVHKHFNIGNQTYEQRKISAVNLTIHYFSPELKQQLEKYDRKHDICDAVLFTIFWARKQKELLEIELLQKKQHDAMSKFNEKLHMSLDDFFDMFRYVPSKNE